MVLQININSFISLHWTFHFLDQFYKTNPRKLVSTTIVETLVMHMFYSWLKNSCSVKGPLGPGQKIQWQSKIINISN